MSMPFFVGVVALFRRFRRAPLVRGAAVLLVTGWLGWIAGNAVAIAQGRHSATKGSCQ
jgi:hypothetical protein